MQSLETYNKKVSSLVESLDEYKTLDTDGDYEVLKKLFDTVYESGILDITTFPKELQDEYKLILFKNLTLVSGTLSFLVIQILAANNIMTKNNFPLKEHYISRKCGIAINHLRAPVTIVSGIKCEGGYILNGKLTWASGYKIFDTLLIGFHENGCELEAMASFEKSDSFTIGDAPKTFVGDALNTVNIELNNYFVKDKDIVSVQKMGNYTKVKSASKTVHFCIYGIGINAIENIEDEVFKNSALKQLETIKEEFMSSSDLDRLDNLRIELFCCVQDIVTTAIVINGGKSILLNSVLQRLYRELIMFNSNGLNNPLKDIFKNRFLNKK
ncbi:MAG: hypothetical protein U9R37_02800 [Campylobacterota bacterium]|nr:hypothetical protein [Campylobacterota bacterium]